METLRAHTFRFHGFELDVSRRALTKDGVPVTLKPKAFEVLLALVESRGLVLSKDELLGKVWPGQFVEEGNLKVHISALRKIFGEGRNDHRYIVTVPGRGYSFVAELDLGAADGVVVERHSHSRIVIDEQADERDVLDERSYEGRRAKSRRLSLVLVSAALLVAAAGAGYLVARRSSTQPAQPGPGSIQIKRLTTNGKVSFAALSPDGKLFAYALKELEQNSLWLGFVEGGEDTLLRPSETGRYNDLAFSADGNFVLFTFSGADSRESVLYRIPTFGGAREKLRAGVSSFGVSPDGRRYAFGKYSGETRTNQLVIARIDNGADTIVDLPGVRSLRRESVSWSPDGGAIAFGATSDQLHDQVFILTEADGAFRQLTSHGWKEIIKTAWTDDGKGLLLVAQANDSNTSVSYSQIWEASLANGEARQLTTDLSSYRSVLNSSKAGFLSVELRQMNNIWVAPSSDLSKAAQVTFGTFGKYDGLLGLDWTSDGKIVFTSTDHQSQVISEMNPDGSGIRQLTPPGYDDSLVNASTDGRYLVFQSSRAGCSDIWRMNADGSDVTRLTTDGESYQPFISPDSRFVYYKSHADGVGGMHRVLLEGGAAEKLTDKEVSYLSLSPDGTRVAAGMGTQLVILPANGGEPQARFDMTRFGTVSDSTRWTADGSAIAYRDRGYGYWLQPVDGRPPRRMPGLPMEKFYNFAWSKDGRYFAFVRGQEIRDVVFFRRAP